MEDMYSEKEKAQVKATLERLDKLLPWLEGQRKHHEMHALLFEHEIARMAEERMILNLTLELGSVSEKIQEVADAVQGMVASTQTTSEEPPCK